MVVRFILRLKSRRALVARLGSVLVLLAIVTGGWYWKCGEAFLEWNCGRILEDGDPERARKWMERGQGFIRRTADSEFFRARVDRKSYRFDDMTAHLREAGRLGCPTERIRRETILAYAQCGQLHETSSYINQFLRTDDSEYGEYCDAFVEGLMKSYRIAESRRLIQSWMERRPLDPRPHVCLGRIHKEMQQFKDAEQCFRKAQALNPRYLGAVLDLAEILFLAKRAGEALPLYEQCVSNETLGAFPRIGQAKCFRAQGRPDAARAILAGVLKANPANAAALEEFGQLALESGDFQTASECFEKSIEVKGMSLVAANGLVQALPHLGRSNETRKYAALAFVEKSNASMTRLNRLLAYIATRSDDVQALHEIGVLYLELGETRSGLTFLHAALDVDPSHAETLAVLEKYRSADTTQHRLRSKWSSAGWDE